MYSENSLALQSLNQKPLPIDFTGFFGAFELHDSFLLVPLFATRLHFSGGFWSNTIAFSIQAPGTYTADSHNTFKAT